MIGNANMAYVQKPRSIQTSYKGYLFRSRLEARWAVFFDAVDAVWSYEPCGYDLSDNVRYLPDFYLPDLDMFVEVKGYMSGKDADKVRVFRDAMSDSRYPLLVVGELPDGSTFDEVYSSCLAIHSRGFTEDIKPFTVAGDVFVFPAIGVDGTFGLFDDASQVNMRATELAYRMARIWGFEFGWMRSAPDNEAARRGGESAGQIAEDKRKKRAELAIQTLLESGKSMMSAIEATSLCSKVCGAISISTLKRYCLEYEQVHDDLHVVQTSARRWHVEMK